MLNRCLAHRRVHRSFKKSKRKDRPAPMSKTVRSLLGLRVYKLAVTPGLEYSFLLPPSPGSLFPSGYPPIPPNRWFLTSEELTQALAHTRGIQVVWGSLLNARRFA